MLPTWAMALTWPSRTWGVKSAGFGFTTTDCGVCTAPAPVGASAIGANAPASSTTSAIVRRLAMAPEPITTSPSARPV